MVKVTPNQTLQVKIGGTGRPVSGQLQFNKDPDFEFDWTTNTPVEISPWDKQNNQPGQQRHLGSLSGQHRTFRPFFRSPGRASRQLPTYDSSQSSAAARSSRRWCRNR